MRNVHKFSLFIYIFLILSSTTLLAQGATITVPDQYPTIQQAIDNSTEDDIIIVTSGLYEECITVDKRLNIMGYGMPEIDGEQDRGVNTVTLNASGILFSGFNVTNGGSSASGIEITANDVEVNNCTVCLNKDIGIKLTGVNGVVLQDNDIRDHSGSYGIYLFSSTNNIIQNNTVKNSNVYNIELDGSSSNIINNNIFSSAGWHGVVISYSSQFNTFSGNVIEENDYGHGIMIIGSDSNIFLDNTVQNNSLDSISYAGIYVNNALNLIFTNNTLSGNNRHGFYLSNCDISQFSNNTVRNTLKPEGADDSTGLYLYSSVGNTLENNTIADNEHRGLFLQDSKNNIFKGNNITGNPYNFGVTVNLINKNFENDIDTSNLVDGKPIIYLIDAINSSINGSSNAGAVYCISCEGVVVEGLTLTNNSYGIVLYDSTNSNIQNNTISSCEEGIFLIDSDNNVITQNNASNNQDYGIRVRSSDYNKIYFNDFANNAEEDYYSYSSETTWRSPIELDYYFGGNQNTSYLGNYWGSYSGSDSSNDGIGDTDFTITGDTNNDEYPLIASIKSYSFAENQPPVANFTYSPPLPDTSDVISFTDESIDIDGSISAWSWDFGDGNTCSQKNPTHLYVTSGFYHVVLNVTDNNHGTDNTTTTIFVHAAGSMTIYVPDNFSTIQGAVNVAIDGDTVLVRDGTYQENVVVNRSISVIGEGTPQLNSTGGTGFIVTSESCTIEGFNITNAKSGDYAGIKLESDQNIIRNNIVVGNDFGIYLASSDNNTLFNNTCINNTGSGIYLSLSMNNTIFNNTCNNNSAYYGIFLQESGGNTLYYNDLDNPNQNLPGMYYNAFDSNTSSIINYWFNSTLLKGNRYSDYEGMDNNSDGIGDTPYEIDYDSGDADLPSSDPYPLMPFGSMPEYQPIISSIGKSDLTYNSITIKWSISNEIVSDNRVLYDTNASLTGAEWSIWDNSTISPQIDLSGLLQNTTYYYECYSYNEDNSSVFDNSSVRSFTTIERSNLIITVDDNNADIPSPPADYSSFAEALNASISGDTILVYNGTYRNNFVVDKSLNITGIGWPVLAGREEDTIYEMGDVVTLESDGCILQGFKIIDAHWTKPGISRPTTPACIRIGSVQYYINSASWSYSGSDNNLIRNNILEDGVVGISVNRYSTDNQIIGNRFNDTGTGVAVSYALDNIIRDNIFTNVNSGITLSKLAYMAYDYYPPTNNTISNNTISGEDSDYGISVGGVSDNTIVNNTLYGETRIEISGERNLISGNSVLGPYEHHRGGIHVGKGEDNTLLNNTVSFQKFGFYLSSSAENVIMRGNQMENNTYNFGFTDDWTYAGHRAATHTIDTSNTINGKPIYYFIGEKDSVYSYSTLNPSPGYLACIDCVNITIKDFYMEKNIQGLFLHNTTESYIDGVTTHANAYSGIFLYDADNLRISNSNIDGNGYSPSGSYAGIYIEDTSGCLMENNTITANNAYGIMMWYGCPDTIIRNCEISNNGIPGEPGSGTGISISGSYADNVTIHSNTISNTHANIQGYGIKNSAVNSTIYNNYFNNTQYDADSYAPGTTWNITPTPGTNIIGGPWIAGNYWSGYNGQDTNQDGLGDTLVPYNVNGKIYEDGDYHPLLDTFVPDEIAPIINLISPVEGNTYVPQLVYLRVSSPDVDIAFWWYSLNSNENVSFKPNTTLTNLSIGENTLRIYVNDTSGNENSTMVNFIVAEDTTSPVIYVLSPENNTEYNSSRDISLEVWSPDTDVFSWWYCLDSGSNITFIPNSTLSDIENGNHTLIVYVDDIVGNENFSEIVFRINVDDDEIPPVKDGGGSDSDVPLIIIESPIEMPENLIIITPEPGRTILRNVNLKYSSPVPLARVYYSVDNGPELKTQPYTTIPIKRLTLGNHVLKVKGVDHYGNSLQASVEFEVVPMALGEISIVGTPNYPDEAVFSFIGRPMNYTLSFEAENIEEEEIHVYLNRYLTGNLGEMSSIQSSQEPGGMIYTPEMSSEWRTYTIGIPADLIVPNSENLLSFIHSTNPNSSVTLDSWSVRNVTMAPETPVSYPSINVFTTDRAISPGEELMTWVEISGITEDHQCEAEVYLVDPDGTVISFPDGGTIVQPLDQSYVRTNHYGRIPGSLKFDETFIPGAYQLVGSLTSVETGLLESFSSIIIYYNNQTSVKLFQNRELYSPGMPVTIDMAITKGEMPENVNVVVLLERPDNSNLFLPYRTETYSSLQYQPLQNQYLTVYDEMITDEWEEGMYSVRSSVFNESGYVLCSDAVSFEVCKEDGVVSIRFGSLAGSSITHSDIRLIDDVTFDTSASSSVTGPHTSVEIEVPVGTYWITGEIQTDDGKIYSIPLNAVNMVYISSYVGKVTKTVSISMNPLTMVIADQGDGS